MKMSAILASATAIWAASVTAVSAQCMTVDPAVVPDIRIDPLDATGVAQVMQPLNLTIRRTGLNMEQRKVLFQIVDEDSPIRSRVGMTGGPQIEWRSDDTSRNIGAIRNETYALLRSGTATLDENETSKQIGLRLFVENLRDDLPAGVYREQYTLRYWCADTQETLPYEVPGIVSVVVQVPNVLSANIAGASGRGEIDFMDFSTRTRSLSINVRSTGGYAVSVRSENGGAMVRDGGRPESDEDRISYSVSFGGHRLTLGSDGGLINPRAGLAGQQIPLEVAVGNVDDGRAGTYRDTIILTLAPVS